MLVTMPASLVFRNTAWRTGVAGTVWNGEVGIAGGATFAWHMAPLRSLTSLAFAADWKATGPNTDLGGQMLQHLGGRTVLDHVSGSADASLFRALQPNLPFTCNLALQIEMRRIASGGGTRIADGKVTTDPGSCRAKNGGGPVAVPALLITAEHVGDRTTIRVAPSAQRLKTLMTAILSEDGTLDIAMTPEGAAILPFVGLPGGARVQGQM
ncbi:MAG: type II secretion system protein N [Sphingomonas sp.]|nr:type II secretion system protein N [Sphingomonas sp.]